MSIDMVLFVASFITQTEAWFSSCEYLVGFSCSSPSLSFLVVAGLLGIFVGMSLESYCRMECLFLLF